MSLDGVDLPRFDHSEQLLARFVALRSGNSVLVVALPDIVFATGKRDGDGKQRQHVLGIRVRFVVAVIIVVIMVRGSLNLFELIEVCSASKSFL